MCSALHHAGVQESAHATVNHIEKAENLSSDFTNYRDESVNLQELFVQPIAVSFRGQELIRKCGRLQW